MSYVEAHVCSLVAVFGMGSVHETKLACFAGKKGLLTSGHHKAEFSWCVVSLYTSYVYVRPTTHQQNSARVERLQTWTPMGNQLFPGNLINLGSASKPEKGTTDPCTGMYHKSRIGSGCWGSDVLKQRGAAE